MKTNKEIATELLEAWRKGVPIDPINSEMKNKTIEDAYEIQKIWMGERTSASKQRIGAKIGLTSFAVQEQLGVNQPDFGILLSDFLLPNNQLDRVQLIQGKAEAEIAVVLKEDILTALKNSSEALQKIDYAMACIEVVDCRIKDWKISIYDTIADNASSAFYVLGKEKTDPLKVNWESASMNMQSDNQKVSEGDATQCLGNPLNALQWLANVMVENNTPLQKGEIVLTGALGPMYNLNKNQYLKAEIETVGTVDLNII